MALETRKRIEPTASGRQITWLETAEVPDTSTSAAKVVTLKKIVPIHWIHELVHDGARLSRAAAALAVAPSGPDRQAKRIWMLEAEVKKIDPTKKVAAPATGDQLVLRLKTTPNAKQAEPMTKSHPIQAVARSDG
jgi:hypothetical protein